MENTISLLIYFFKTNLLLLTNSFIMKKLFTILAAMLISMVGFAQTPVYELVPASGSNTGYASNCDVTIAGITWNLTGNSTMQPWRIGGKSITNQDRALYSKTAMPFNISKIEVTHGTASSITVNSFKVIVSDAANGAGVEIPVTFKASTTTTIELPAGADYTNKYFKFLYNVTVSGSSNKYVQFTGAKFYAAQAADEAKAPTITGEANFAEKTTVTITAAEGAKIYYTLDGTDPTNASTEYTAPFELTETTTVKAIAYEGEKTSIVMSSTFTKATVATCAEAAEAAMKVASNNALTSTYYVVVGYVTEVIDAALSNGQQRFWVSDTKGGENTLQSYYCNVPRVLEVGDKVQMFGQLTKYNTNPQMKNGQVTILPEDAPAATVIVAENTTISEMGQNLVLSATVEDKALSIMLWPGVTKGFGTYSGEGEGDYYGTFGAASLSPVGDATYTDNGNGTFTFKAMMTDGTAQYDITMNGLIPVKHTYTVAGSPVAVFGTEWDPSNTANDMFLMYGTIYAWEKYNVTLSAGKIQFKVCEDHAWTTAYPASNYELDIPASGIYTIMIMFDAASGMVEAFAEKTGDAVVIPTIAIAGDMNGWNTSANTFTIAEDEKTASLALNLEAKDYGFKMIIGGSWTNDGQVITRENNSAVYTGANVNDNGTLSADVAGEYTFTWTYATSTLVVTYPAATPEQPGDTTVTPEPEQPTVTYTVAGSSEVAFGTTWSCDNAANDMTLQADGTYKWEKTGLELLAGSLDFKVCKDHSWDVAYPGSDYKLTIPATGIYTVTITFNPTTEEVNATATKTGDVVIIPTVAMHGNFAGASSWNDTENFTIASDEKTATLVMNLEARSDYEFGMRIGGKGDWTANGAAFARESNSAVIEKGTGNITLIADVAGEYTFTWTYATNTLTITFPAKSTVGFEEIEAAENPVKFIENGKLYIIREGNIYDATGARVK